ncbi:MAG: hypothetical protein ABJO27_09925 [Pseudoruegeria sp.]
MVYTRPTVGAILGINWRFLCAYLWAWLAYASWPNPWLFEGAALWTLHAVSAVSALIAYSLLHSNLSRIATHYSRDREVVKFNRHGHAPRSDRMANRNDLKSGGLLR